MLVVVCLFGVRLSNSDAAKFKFRTKDSKCLGDPKNEPSRSCGVLLGLARLQRRREMIEFLVQMPTGTVIFLATAVLSLAATLIAMSR
jgi:hypothetical protein